MRTQTQIEAELVRVKELMTKDDFQNTNLNSRYWALQWVLGGN